MKKTQDEEKVKVTDLINRRKILEQRRDHLTVMKRRFKSEPVKGEQREIMFEGIEKLHQELNKLRPVPVDPSKFEVVTPTMIVKKENTLMITVRDVNNDVISESVELTTSSEVIATKGVSHGKYKVIFTPSRCDVHMISMIANGQHILGNPYR